MSRDLRIALPSLAVAMAVVFPSVAGAAPELAFHGSWIQQDCQSEDPCTRQSMILSLAAGGRTRWRASAGALRARAPEELAWTMAGTVPLGEEQIRRRQREDGRGPGGSGAFGMGAGRPEAAAAAVSEEDRNWVSGTSDLYVGTVSRLAGGGSRLFALDVEVDVKAPLASEEKGLGTGEWDGRFGLVAERRYWALTLFGGAGWSRLGDPDWAELKDVPDGFVGVEIEPGGSGWRWSAWVEGASEVVDEAGPTGALVVACRSGSDEGWSVRSRAGLTGASETFGFRMGYRWGGSRSAGRRGGPGS